MKNRLQSAENQYGTQVDPRVFFQGTIAVLVPHMDDAVLACGGTIAQLADKAQAHVIYATDGRKSPTPIWPGRAKTEVDLCPIRMTEARQALATLGIPDANIHFLNLPDGRLRYHKPELYQSLSEHLQRLQPAFIWMPFRYDRHPDHVTLNHVTVALHQQEIFSAKLVEYFVYYQWRLLAAGDIRAHIKSGQLVQVSNTTVADLKRGALDRFVSQTTRFFPWQTRPNLTSQLLDEVSSEPEILLPYDPEFPSASVLEGPIFWIKIAHRLEPVLKKHKDQAVAIMKQLIAKNGALHD